MNSKPEGLSWLLISSPELYVARKTLQQEVMDLLAQCAGELRNEIKSHGWLPEKALGSEPKITRGDNYLDRPWMVLDYPRVFEKEAVFAFRTLFLFGDAVHCTFHLSGHYLNEVNVNVKEDDLLTGLKACSEGSPWVHHVTADVFRDLTPGHLAAEHGFLKFGKRISYENWSHLPQQITEVFRQVSSLLHR